METRMLGRLWPVSALTLGGGGVGQLWGLTTRDECIATVRTAIDCGITLLDMAPAYGNGEAENVVGAAFDGRLPTGRYPGDDQAPPRYAAGWRGRRQYRAQSR